MIFCLQSYSYVIDVSVEKEYWERVVDYSGYLCRSWQYLHFEKRPARFIRITGTHNTVNRVFHLVAIQAMLTQNVPKLVDGLVVPKQNVATVEKSAIVLEGVSRNKNSLLNGNTSDYDWDCGKWQNLHCLIELQVNIFYRRLHMSPARQRKHFDPVGSALPPQFHQDPSVGLWRTNLQLLHGNVCQQQRLGDADR